jgi:hypothetical protein
LPSSEDPTDPLTPEALKKAIDGELLSLRIRIERIQNKGDLVKALWNLKLLIELLK